MHIAVNTAISLPEATPSATIFGIKPIAAPAAPSAVTGTETPFELVKPNSGLRMKSSFSPTIGKKPIPSYAAPVNVPSADAPFVSIITMVQIIRTPGMIAIPISTPDFPPSSMALKKRPPAVPGRTAR